MPMYNTVQNKSSLKAACSMGDPGSHKIQYFSKWCHQLVLLEKITIISRIPNYSLGMMPLTHVSVPPTKE